MNTCPKCGHMKDGGDECQSCGVIFSRYEQSVKKKEQKEHEQRSANRSINVLQIALLVIVTASITYYFVKPESSVETLDPANETDIAQIDDTTFEIVPDVIERVVVTEQSIVNTAPLGGTTAIEHARRATVSIETAWGGGSGFFISEDYIVTNRHVVEMNPDHIAEFKHKVNAAKKMIELERKKIKGWKEKMNQLPDGPAREQLRVIIKESERDLAKVMPQYKEARKRLKQMEQNAGSHDFKIVFADGSEQYISYARYSDNNDLALLSISATGNPVLQRAPDSAALKQGDKVYTIGSPAGLRNTVTAGIFSGYRKDRQSGEIFLQTDAPINPGNSGGPLIDENGYVWGVNTMVLQNTEGIGFAIPIDKVFEDFGGSLY